MQILNSAAVIGPTRQIGQHTSYDSFYCEGQLFR